jgi:xyloglucan-specific endo-beta-1,4-glucanase
MIWLATYGGAKPASSSGSPVATASIAGYTWQLFDGWNGNTHVFCQYQPMSWVDNCLPFTKAFVCSTTVNSFSGDIMDFLNHLAANNGFPTSQYLNVLQGGTEAFVGTSVTLSTSQYTISLNVGEASTSISTSESSSTITTTSSSQPTPSSSSTSDDPITSTNAGKAKATITSYSHDGKFLFSV